MASTGTSAEIRPRAFPRGVVLAPISFYFFVRSLGHFVHGAAWDALGHMTLFALCVVTFFVTPAETTRRHRVVMWIAALSGAMMMTAGPSAFYRLVGFAVLDGLFIFEIMRARGLPPIISSECRRGDHASCEGNNTTLSSCQCSCHVAAIHEMEKMRE